MGGQGDPGNRPQLALGSPFKCFQLWQGVRGTLHCKSLKKNPNFGAKQNKTKQKKQLVQMAFRSLATNLGSESWGAGNPQGRGDVWL